MFKFLRALFPRYEEERIIKPRRKSMAKDKEEAKEEKKKLSDEEWDNLNTGPWAIYPK